MTAHTHVYRGKSSESTVKIAVEVQNNFPIFEVGLSWPVRMARNLTGRIVKTNEYGPH